jgi:hypothetical protein
MLSLRNSRCFLDWKRCQLIMWILSDVKSFFHDLIWGDMCIGKDMNGRFHDQFEVICGLEQMIKDNVMT